VSGLYDRGRTEMSNIGVAILQTAEVLATLRAQVSA
jgi:hypothetical protein